MRRALRKAGWALAAAGGIGIAAPALAQSQVVQVIGPGGHVVEQGGEVIVMTEGQARYEESQVEVGLLADPMLFSYGLGAHVQGATVEVRGFVPTEAARDQALKVAREQTTLHVVDKLKVAPNLATRSSIDKPEHIQRTAKELIEEAFPAFGRGVEVTCDARGRVTVSGSVGSHEDRLLVSRKLRQVAGCSCVVNHLSIAGEVSEARAAETTHVVTAPQAAPAMTRPAVRKTEPVAPPVPARTVAAPSHKEMDPPTLAMPRVDVAPPARPMPQPAPAPVRPVVTAAPKEVDPPTLPMPHVYQEPVALPPASAPVLKPVQAPSAARPAPSIEIDKPYGSGKAAAPTIDLPPVPHPETTPVSLPTPAPAPAAKAPLVVNEPAAKAAPLPAVPSLPAAPAMPPPPKPSVTPLPKLPEIKKPAGGSEESFVSEGTITFDEEPPVAKPAPPPLPKAPPPPPKAPAPAPTSTTLPTPKPVTSPAPVPPLPATSMALPTPKPVTSAPKAPAAPAKAAEGTMTLTPPPMPPSRPAADAVKLTAAAAKPPSPPPPPRPNVPPAVRLKERVQGVIGAAYEVKVTAKGRDHLDLEITGRVAGEDKRVMKQIQPVLESEEFRGLELNIDVITPDK